MKTPYHIGVIGAGRCPYQIYKIAEDVGREIGKRGWILFCGGLGGVMEAVSKGCNTEGGLTVGILPGHDRTEANPYIKIAIPTGLGEARNLIIIRCSDIIISIGGGYGTLSEIGFALKQEKPVIGIKTWENIPGVHYVSDPKEAISLAEKLLT